MIGILTRPVPYSLACLVARAAVGPFATKLARSQIDLAERPFEGNPFTRDPARYGIARALYRTWAELRLGEPTWAWVRFACDIEHHLAASGAAERIECPVTIVAAGQEKLVDNAASARFAARLRHGNFILVDGAYHELLMEENRYRAQFWQAFDTVTASPGQTGSVSSA